MRSSAEQAKARRACFQDHHQHDDRGCFMTCHICKGRINVAVEGWEAEHVIPHGFGGTEVLPAHVGCHRQKTSTQDVPAIAKSKRVSDKHVGIKRKGWGGKYKKKLNGEVVER
ncbi:MAG: hypothetical protein ACRCXM_02600 [Beijerinckiaceae bacterium]